MSTRPSSDRRFADRSLFPRLGDWRCSCVPAESSSRYRCPPSKSLPWKDQERFVRANLLRLQESLCRPTTWFEKRPSWLRLLHFGAVSDMGRPLEDLARRMCDTAASV